MPHRVRGHFLRSVSFSAILHMGIFAVTFLVLLWLSMMDEWRRERRSSFVATLEEPLLDQPPPEEEPPPEVEEDPPEEEPELVEQPEIIEPIPDDPDPEPLDWLPPVDPFAELPPDLVIRPRPEPKPEPPPPPPPVVPKPEPQPPDPVPVEDTPPELVAVPVALEHPLPVYPRKAERLGWQGTVRLRIRVNAAGVVLSVEVAESSGHEILDEAAVQSFRKWVFCERQPGDPEIRTFAKPFTFQID